jgi:multicomponent K+:H+ antiporter subunit F
MMIDILSIALGISIFSVSVCLFLCIWRLVIGPSVIDRLLAIDTIFIYVTALIILLGMYWRSFLFFEAALLIALLGFVSTAALARYFSTGHVID